MVNFFAVLLCNIKFQSYCSVRALFSIFKHIKHKMSLNLSRYKYLNEVKHKKFCICLLKKSGIKAAVPGASCLDRGLLM